jgi:predicted glycosyltransferase
LVKVIEANVAPGAPIFAVPNDSTLYFLTQSTNPFGFYNTGLSIQNTNELNAVLDRLRTEPPHLVTFRPDDQYNNWSSRAVMEYVRKHYDRIDVVGGVEVYLLKKREA